MKRRILSAVLAFMMVFSIMQPLSTSAEEVPEEESAAVAAEETEAAARDAEETESPEETTEDAADDSSPVYALTASADVTEATAGDTVSLSATVTVDGTEVTDLEDQGLYLWWWTDTWNDHTDGNGDAIYSNYDNNSGRSLTADVTLPSEGTYYIVAELQDSGYADVADTVVITITVAEAEVEVELTDLTASLTNPDFETGD
ncbi:MAG: hypothetical protein LUC30_03835, partial [Clostridiales bacterium]|nr:hypothetical protein [Clostridiales bacterium]